MFTVALRCIVRQSGALRVVVGAGVATFDCLQLRSILSYLLPQCEMTEKLISIRHTGCGVRRAACGVRRAARGARRAARGAVINHFSEI